MRISEEPFTTSRTRAALFLDNLKRENERLRSLLGSSGNNASAAAYHEEEEDEDDHESVVDTATSAVAPLERTNAHLRSPNPADGAHHRQPLNSRCASTNQSSSASNSTLKATPEQTPYYGPTSAHFDVEECAPSPDLGHTVPLKGSWRGTLVATAAIERQKEQLNYVSNNLDCDGWDPELVMHLLTITIHWNRQHHNLSLIYRPLFMRDMARGGPYFSKLLLNAILFTSSEFSPRKDIRKIPDEPSSAGWQYRQRVRTLLGEALDQSAIPTIQALITVASGLFAIGEARSTSWLYSGVAFRMLIDLGLHRDSEDLVHKGKISIEDLECRRRVFWGAFIFDKIHSMYLGRPATLQEADISVPIEFFDDLEELEPWVPLEPGNQIDDDYALPKHGSTITYSVTAYVAHCKLSVLLARILTSAYTNAALFQRDIEHAQADIYLAQLDSIDNGLQNWLATLPDCIRYEPWLHPDAAARSAISAPSTLSVTLMYHLSVILLHRPFVTQGHLYDARVAEQSLRTCTAAAIKLACIIQHYCVAFTIRRAPYFVAYCAYVACTVLTRVAHRVTTGRSDSGDLQHWLHMLLEILRRSARTNAGVKRANTVLASLLKRNNLDSEMFRPLPRIEEDFVAPPTNISVAFGPEHLSEILDSFSMANVKTTSTNAPDNETTDPSIPNALDSMAAVEPRYDELGNIEPANFPDMDVFYDSIFGFHSSVDPFGEWSTFTNADLNMFL